MTSDPRIGREIAQIPRLQHLLASDTVLPLRMSFERKSLDSRHSTIRFDGIQSMITDPGRSRRPTSSTFLIDLRVPSGYPWSAIPQIQFLDAVPFHPHVFRDGRICWGTADTPQPDLMLVDWIARVVEYLQFNQASLIGINPNSPANSEALAWWRKNGASVARHVPPIDLARLRFWVNQSKFSGA
jgi:ubiquitin-protein ligase